MPNIREDFNTLKSDLQLDLNTLTTTTRETKGKHDHQIQQINHKLQIECGELKTELEGMKLELITKWAPGIVLAVTGMSIAVRQLL